MGFKSAAIDLWEMSRVDAKRSGKNRFSIIRDAIACRKQYGCSVNDYLAFGFSMLDPSVREDYFSLRMNYNVTQQINDMRYENKWEAYQVLPEFYHRDLVHLSKSTKEEIQEFLNKHANFFAKKPDSFGGKGVEYVEQAALADIDGVALAEKLKSEGFVLLEEPLDQDEKMNGLNPSSVNTLRIITLTNEDLEVMFLPYVLRVGANASKVDNVRSGGLYTLLDKEGRIALDGFYQESYKNDELILATHPVTGLKPKGFEVPLFQETIQQIEVMAKRLPQVPLVGWDICISKTGPALVELNCFPSIDFNQNYYFTKILDKDSVGAKGLIEKHLGIKIQDGPEFKVVKQ